MTTQEQESTPALRYLEGRIEEQSSQLQVLAAGQQRLQSDMNRGFQEFYAYLDTRIDGVNTRIDEIGRASCRERV